MRIGFVVNRVETEQAGYTTTRLAMSAVNRGHQVWVMGVGDFAFDPDDCVRARARVAPQKKFKSNQVFLDEIQNRAPTDRITVDDLDVLLLRNDPAEDHGRRPWAQTAGIMFGRAAVNRGVIVLNDPNGLAKAMNKMYFQLYPEEVRPRTLISRDANEIKAFAKEQGGDIVIKPLQGSGGQGVFLVKANDLGNINQMIESVARDGYIIAQEYLPKAAEGDMRLFVMNGQPLRYKGKYAAFRRQRASEDIRTNIHAGGKKAQAVVDDEALRIAEIVRPKLVEDGMFLVGLDIVGDKLMEINVFSPGGLGSAQSFEGINFADGVIAALERKVRYVGFYKRKFNNVEMATL